ncbi:MAG: hypothetical protein JSS09_00710, partial [Verrucomicrobia bacterium]|nr:hypothetical protein [Verrucomicrobiota bacterium]
MNINRMNSDLVKFNLIQENDLKESQSQNEHSFPFAEEPKEDNLTRLRTETNLSQIKTLALLEESAPSSLIPQPSNLQKLVGLPLRDPVTSYFQIHNTNSKGEATGVADFKKDDGSSEKSAWYWNPNEGFKIIISESELLKIYEKDGLKIPFQFYTLSINDAGVIAGSFLIDQPGFNQNPWFWWSAKQGIHLSSPPIDIYQIVQGINNKGHVLINEINKRAFVKNINNDNYQREIEFPSQEIIKQKIKPFILLDSSDKIQDFIFKIGSINTVSIDDNSNVSGKAYVRVWHRKGSSTKDFSVILNFNSFERLEDVSVAEIRNFHDKNQIIHQNTSTPLSRTRSP